MNNVVFAQDSGVFGSFSLPLACLNEASNGDLFIERERLIDHMLESLRSDVVLLEGQLSIAHDKSRDLEMQVGALMSEKVVDSATRAGQERLIVQLKADIKAAGRSASDEAAAARLGGMVVDLQGRVADLSAELERVTMVADRVSDATAQAADATARMNHAEALVKRLTTDVAGLNRALDEATKSVAGATQAKEEAESELSRVSAALQLADRSKANALASQAAAYDERIAKLVKSTSTKSAIGQGELQALQAKVKEGELAQRSVGELEAVVRIYRDQIRQLEGEVSAQSETLLRQNTLVRNQGEKVAEINRELLTTRYMIAYKMAAAIYHSDAGAVRILALNAGSLPGLMCHEDISLIHPVCWWMGATGMGCLLALSTNLDDDGRPKLIMPADIGEIGEAVPVPNTMPPKAEFGAIADAMAAINSEAMGAELDRAAATAEALFAHHSPEIARTVEIKLQRHRAKVASEQLMAQQVARKAKAVAKRKSRR